jgi:hypothetical protein
MNLGTVYADPGLNSLPQAHADPVQAATHYAAAQAILEKLDRENADYQSLRAEVHHLIGRMHRKGGRPRDAIAPFDSALAILTGLTDKYTDVPEYRFRLGMMHHAQGVNFADLGQLGRASTSYQKAAAETEALVREYDLEDYQNELGTLAYDRACLAGLQAAALKDAPLAPAERQQKLEQFVQEACDHLAKSWELGFLQRADIYAHFHGDSDLKDLRGAEEFKKLVGAFEKQRRSEKSTPRP